jgi:hypothetical protein
VQYYGKKTRAVLYEATQAEKSLVPKRPMTAGEERRYAKFRCLLVEEREKAGLTQGDVGAKLIPARPQSYIGKIESGTRRLDALEFWDIARVVGYDPCDLMNRLEAQTGKRASRRSTVGNKSKK